MNRAALRIGLTRIAAAFCLTLAGIALASPVDNAYLEGYAAGLLSKEFAFDFTGIKVRRGVMKVPVGGLAANDRTRVLQLLATIPGVFEVRPIERIADRIIEGSAEQDGLRMTGLPSAAIFETGALPAGHLFRPLLADPRWAHFSAAFRNYVDDELDGNNNASVSFGETLPFYRGNLGASAAQWEIGLQAGVFSEFNLDARSSDLINSDFVASIYSSLRIGAGSAFLRVYHQSSHLGDEFRNVSMTLRHQSGLISVDG